MDPHLQNAFSQQASLEVEQEIEPGLTVALNYQHVRGEHLLLSINRNAPACLAATDPVNLCRPDPTIANNKQYSSAGDSYYDGLGISIIRRPAHIGSFRLSYTWSHAVDDLGEFFFSSPINNFFPGQDRSRSDDDQRHRLTFDGLLHTPLRDAHSLTQHLLYNWQFGTVLQYTSELPFNIVTGGQTVQQTTQRPCTPGGSLTGITACTLALPGAVIGRNAGTGFNFVNLNSRLTRRFTLTESVQLEAIAQAFNTLNTRNNQIPNTTFGTGPITGPAPSTFGVPSAVADPRNIELALRLRF